MTGEKKGSNQKEERCKALRHDGAFCDRKLYDDKHCIFHSKDIEGKKDKFNDAFWNNFQWQKENKKIYDFSRFVFPGDIIFMKREFEKKKTYFRAAQFYGMADFGEVKYAGWVDFMNAQFSGKADFSNAQFSGEAYFLGAQFSGRADFSKAQFSGWADFSKAQFSGNTVFWKAQFSGKADFSEAQFSGKADFSGSQFSRTVSFRESTFSGVKLTRLFDSLRNRGIKRIAKGRYKIRDFRFHLGEKIAKEYPVIDRMTKDAWYLDDFKANHPVIYWLWWFFADCGRSFFRWALWALGLALLFSLIYLFIGPTGFKPKPEGYTWFSFFYYSIVTFTTLGFGDITPIKWFTEILVTIEVILGYIMLGGLISILANKLARRS